MRHKLDRPVSIKRGETEPVALNRAGETDRIFGGPAAAEDSFHAHHRREHNLVAINRSLRDFAMHVIAGGITYTVLFPQVDLPTNNRAEASELEDGDPDALEMIIVRHPFPSEILALLLRAAPISTGRGTAR